MMGYYRASTYAAGVRHHRNGLHPVGTFRPSADHRRLTYDRSMGQSGSAPRRRIAFAPCWASEGYLANGSVYAAIIALIGRADRRQRAAGAGPGSQRVSQCPGTKHWAAGAYIVALNDGVSVDDVANQRVTSRGGYVSQRYHAALNGFAANLSEAEVNDLAADSRVESIMPDFAVHASTQTTPTGIQRIQALTSPLAQIDGVDQRVDVDVAVLDTGSGPHSDLNIAGGYNCTSTNTSAYNDNHGHGTHVAGTIGAIDNGSGVVGVAPARASGRSRCSTPTATAPAHRFCAASTGSSSMPAPSRSPT